MPLAGLIDEQGASIEWKDVAKGRGVFSDPPQLMMALFADREPYCDFSVTELMNDPYHLQLKKRFDFFEHPDDIMDRLLGTAIHAHLEGIGALDEQSEVERRFEVVISGATIGGTADLIVPPVLWDYKTVTMGKLRLMAKGTIDAMEKYEQQLNSYAWMLAQEPVADISELRVRVIVRDWRFYEFRRAGFNKKQYPRGAIVEVPFWSDEQTERWLKRRIKIHLKAEKLPDEDLVEAGECDTWNGLRCEHYCPMGSVCEFYRERQQHKEDQPPEKPTTRKKTTKKRK